MRVCKSTKRRWAPAECGSCLLPVLDGGILLHYTSGKRTSSRRPLSNTRTHTADMKPEERATFILGQLNAGLRTEWSQIEGLEATLQKQLHEAKARADAHIAPNVRATWDEAWNAVYTKLNAIEA